MQPADVCKTGCGTDTIGRVNGKLQDLYLGVSCESERGTSTTGHAGVLQGVLQRTCLGISCSSSTYQSVVFSKFANST